MAKKPVKSSESITASAEAVKSARRQRWNPLRTLTPESLTRALDGFEYGDMREFAMLAEIIADRDDTIKGVKGKREKATAAREWKILKRDKSPEAEKHQEVLKSFWDNVRAENAYDRNERGGMGRLIKQMMTSVSYRYAVHHIVWKPEPGKLRATFEFVPLWFFENREGKLKFIRDGLGMTGEAMDPSEWMVSCGDGLMIACAIQYLGKRYCMQDWLAFSEKFSMPGIVGATSAAKDSAEGKAMKAAVEAFGQDWTAVMYGVADTSKPPIHLIQPNGNPAAMPMPAYIERADRKIASLYMGEDLSTMSSKDGQGTGASVQDDQTEGLVADDCMTISETLQEVERQVIRWHFGEDVEPLAYIEVQPPVQVDKKFILEAIKILTDMGVRLPVLEILESLGFSEADAGDASLLDFAKSIAQPDAEKPAAANAMDHYALSEWLFDFRSALASDLQPLGEALVGALQAGDLPAMQAALRKISQNMPELAGEAAALSEVLAEQMTDAFLEEESRDQNPEARQEAANGGFNPDQPRLHGQFSGYSDGGGGGQKHAAVGKTGTWEHLGLESISEMRADQASTVSDVVRARLALERGIPVKDVFGTSLNFGPEVLAHWETENKPPGEQDRRLRRLSDGVRSVTSPHEVWESPANGQKTYLRKFSEGSGSYTVSGFVADQSGHVTSYFHDRRATSINKRRSGKLLHKR